MVVTFTPDEFWKVRLLQALESARSASSERSRVAYLQLAEHYLSMHRLMRGDGRDTVDGLVPNTDPSAAASTSAPTYASVHDALMQVA